VGHSTGVGLLLISPDDVLHTWQIVSQPFSGQNVLFGSKSTSEI